MNVSSNISDDEFIELINNNRNKLYKTAISILKNDDDACDAIQEALMSSYKNLDSLKNKEYFLTWLTRILINACYRIINKNKRVVSVDGTVTEETFGYYDTYKIESSLENVLNQIDDELREIVVLYYYNDLAVEEISSILNIPSGTVKSRLSRARNKIKEIIKRKEGEL